MDRKVDDALWKRYSKAREAFNRRRGAHFAELDRERAAAKTRKETLCVRAEELSSSTDWVATATTFRELLVEWKAAGRAPRDADDALWRRFKGAQDVFFSARNNAASERDAEFEENAVKKEELLKVGDHIDPSGDLDAARAALRDLQAKWEAIGKVPREQMHDLERGYAPSRRGSATPPTRSGGAPIPKRSRGRRSSASESRRSRSRPPRPKPPATPAMPNRPAPRPTNGASGPMRRRERSATADLPLSPPRWRSPVRASPFARRSASAAALRRCSSAASCTMYASTPRGPMEREQHHARSSPPTARPTGRRRADAGGLTGPHRQHAGQHRHRRTRGRHPGQHPPPGDQRQHREPDPEDQREPAEHPRRQRDRLAMAVWLPISTSTPRAAPVCGNTNDTSNTNTRIGTTTARGPGSISRPTRRSADSIVAVRVDPSGARVGGHHPAHPVGRRHRFGLARCRACQGRWCGGAARPRRVAGPGAAVGEHDAVGDQVVRRGRR